jgi:hypothetical protein
MIARPGVNKDLHVYYNCGISLGEAIVFKAGKSGLGQGRMGRKDWNTGILE